MKISQSSAETDEEKDLETCEVQKDPHFRLFIWKMSISCKVLFCRHNGSVSILSQWNTF